MALKALSLSLCKTDNWLCFKTPLYKKDAMRAPPHMEAATFLLLCKLLLRWSVGLLLAVTEYQIVWLFNDSAAFTTTVLNFFSFVSSLALLWPVAVKVAVLVSKKENYFRYIQREKVILSFGQFLQAVRSG